MGSGSDLDAGAGRGPGGRREAGIVVDEREGRVMSYARFGCGDVYVFMSTSGHLECCGCILGDQWSFASTQEMVDHLAEHRAAGHDVPDGIDPVTGEVEF